MGIQEQLLLQSSLREELGRAFLCTGKREVRIAVGRGAAGSRSKHLLSWKVDKDLYKHTHTHTHSRIHRHTCARVCTHAHTFPELKHSGYLALWGPEDGHQSNNLEIN